MKIKIKKQLTLPQLIEWAWENSITNLSFRGHGKEGHLVVASFNDKGEFTSEWCIYKDDIFEIEVEEEITEDTVLPILIERRDFGNELTYSRYEYIRIKDIKEESSTLFYVENDDKSLTLIWRDGKMVE